MAANRFDTSANQEYVSTYVPKPFELMYKLGMGMKQEHEKQQAESDALADQLNKIKVVNEVLSEGSGDDLGIKSRKIGYGDFKNEVLNKYSQESKRLADEYQATGDADKFKQGIAKQKADFSQDIQKLKIAEANSAVIEEMNKKIRENKDIGIEGNEYVLNPLAEEGRRLLDNPYTTQYQGAAIGDALKIEDEINKSAQHFADQIGQGGVRTDSHGNVIYEKTHGVTADRIKDEVYRSYDKGVGLHTQQQVLRSLRNAGIDPNKEKIIKVPTKFDATGKPTAFEEVKTTEFNDRYNQAKQNYAQAVVAKAEKSVLDQTIRKDWQLAKQWDWAHDQKVVEDATKLIGDALPGSQVDVLSKDPDAQEFIGKGIIKVNADGSIDLDRNAVLAEKGKIFTVKNTAGKTYTFSTQQEASTFVKNMSKDGGMKFTGITQKPNSDLDLRIDKFMEKAAKVAGFSPQQLSDARSGKMVNGKGEKISWSSLSGSILTAYNQLTKVRMGGVQLPAAVQEVESARVSASPSSYDVYDPIKHTAIPNTINKGDKVLVGERVYVDGQAFDKTTIQRGNDSNGNPITETVLLKPKNLERNDYFDRGVASTQNAILDMTITGGDMPSSKLAKHIQGYNPNLTGDAKKEQDSKLFHVTKDFDDDNDPLTPSVKTKVSVFANGVLSNDDNEQVSYYFIKNDNNLQQQAYVLNTPKGKLRFNDYSKFLTHADAAYYLYGQGKHDATAMKNKRLYEQMLSETTKSNSSEDLEDLIWEKKKL